MKRTQDIWKRCLIDARETLEFLMSDTKTLEQCSRFSDLVIQTAAQGGNIFTCGNGGSHCDAMHFAEELTGRYRKERRPLGALALGDSAHVTCVTNDYGFDHIFSRQLEGLGRPGDLLLGLSTSGNSRNVIEAFGVAKTRGIRTVALLGKGGGILKDLAEIAIIAPGSTSDRIQEIHIKLIHIVIETLERDLFPENYD